MKYQEDFIPKCTFLMGEWLGHVYYMDKSTGAPTHYSCSAMETHAMKFLADSFHADVNARGSLELHGYRVSGTLGIFMHLSAQQALCNFMWVSHCGS